MKIKNISVIDFMVIISLAIFIISLIPILYVSFYSHPVTDDFTYSANVYHTIISGGNFFDIISTAISKVAYTYMNWQGTFSAVFIFSMQPAIFSENLYFITTFIIVFSLSFSTFFLIDTLVTKLFNSKRKYSLLISSLILLCTIQFIPNKNQGLYWYNGSTYYSLFYSFSLIFIALIIRIYLTNKKIYRIALYVCTIILAIVIGGGNYSTALFTICAFTLIIIFSLKYNKTNNKPYNHIKFIWFVIWTVLLISFIISIVAPGNSVRAQDYSDIDTSVLKSIFMSIFYFIVYMQRWTTAPNIIVFILITPVLFKISENVKFKFNYPLLFSAISFLCFATQLTPPLYAIGTIGQGRQVNI